jgi:hypothetical protein
MASLTSLDQITRRWLLENGRPIHYYLEGLLHASTCLRELTFDSLQVVNTKILTLNDYGAIDLPNDFTDEVMVGVSAGGKIQPVPKTTGLNPLRYVDDDFNYVNYTDTVQNAGESTYGFIPGAMWFWNMNEWGEPTGRYFGAGGGAKANGYQVFRERNQIQLTGTFTSPTAVLMYISDGQSADNATQIDTRAWSAINAFIAWKTSPNKNNRFSAEGSNFSNQRRLLRAKLNDLTVADIINIVRKNSVATAKN